MKTSGDGMGAGMSTAWTESENVAEDGVGMGINKHGTNGLDR